MNDATRLVGGALGVAVLGSLMTSSYRGAMHSAPAGTQDSVGVTLTLRFLPARAGRGYVRAEAVAA
jgi:hypothetical protein